MKRYIPRHLNGERDSERNETERERERQRQWFFFKLLQIQLWCAAICKSDHFVNCCQIVDRRKLSHGKRFLRFTSVNEMEGGTNSLFEDICLVGLSIKKATFLFYSKIFFYCPNGRIIITSLIPPECNCIQSV